MTKLKQLCIGNSVHLNDDSLMQITGLTNLEHLSIFSAAITDKAAEQLNGLTKLTTSFRYRRNSSYFRYGSKVEKCY
jgi:hypothetical protein